MEAARAEKNGISEKVGALRREKKDATELQERSKELAAAILTFEESLKALDARFAPIEETLPNIPHASVPAGSDESANVVVKTWGEPTRSTSRRRRTGSSARRSASSTSSARRRSRARGSPCCGRGVAADARADQVHARPPHGEHGYTEVWPPAIVNARRAARHRPAAEVRGGPVPASAGTSTGSCRRRPRSRSRTSTATRSSRRPALPISYCAYSAVLPRRGGRRRQGHARADPPAPVRQGRAREAHAAGDALRRARGATRDAERVLQRLGLHYRASCCAAATSGSRPRRPTTSRSGCPGQDAYREISSCSNFEDFQARRAEIRVKARGAGRQAPERARPHAERLGHRGRPDARRDPREVPAEGRLRRDPEGPAAVLRRRNGDQEGLTAPGWRRRRDSNPRYLAVQRFSRPPP